MKFEILGFNQAEVLHYDLDLIDLTLLDYIWSMSASPSTEKIQGENNLSYVWLCHKKVLYDLPILNIQEEALKKRFAKLIKLGMVKSIVHTHIEYGRRAYYAITSLCERLKFTEVYSNTLRENPESVENNASVSKYTSDKNTSSNNIKSNQQELLTDNTNITNKEDTYKEKAQKFVADYNSICKSLPKCTRITVKRSKGIVSILKKFSEEEILEVFNKLEASDFCKGNNDNGWRASLDFILREDKFVNVLEGKYDNKGKRNNFEKITKGEKYAVSAEEKEEMRKAVERGELEVY